MSHLKEREEKNCLNCNAQVTGAFCHVCGQENVEPDESAWQLVAHFFNDITHFDGKFFSMLKLLITKPGFLSAEYKRGRRASYLNPVRMYIFTSFVFFIIFFWIFSADTAGFVDFSFSGHRLNEIEKMDSTTFAEFTKTLNDGKALTRAEFAKYVDSDTTNSSFTIIGESYQNRAEYDSLLKAGEVKDSWLGRKMAQKNFEIKEKYKSQKEMMRSFWGKLMHYFPQILFISLPFFAMLLSLIYRRRKEYYFVSHGIYSVHLYIFYFIVLLISVGLNKIEAKTGLSDIEWLQAALYIFLFIYEYKAMRNFYAQGRAKTLLKFFLALLGRFLIIVIFFIIFFLLSVYNL